jgi:hypothetical protein
MVELRFGGRAVAPVDAFVRCELRQARGHVDEGVAVAWPGFDQEHPGVGILGQPFASTQPAEPAPMMMVSYTCIPWMESTAHYAAACAA